MVRRFALSSIRLYLASVVGSSTLVVAISLLELLSGHVALGDLSWLIGSAVLITIATIRPVELRPHVRFSLRTAPQLMVAILLGPAPAVVVTAIGVSAGYIYHLSRGRHNLTDLLFNSAQSVLATIATATGYGLVRATSLGTLADPLALLTAAVIMHLSNKLLVAGAIALSGQEVGLVTTFFHLVWDDPIQYATLLVIGMVGVLLSREQALWAVPLLIVPVVLVEYMLVKQRAEAERERKLVVMEQINVLKRDFIAGVTHDLRSPLMVITLFGEFLALRADELSAAERQAIEEMNLSAERLTEMIETLLQFSELDAGMVILQPQSSDVLKIVQHALDQLARRAEQNGVKVALKHTPHNPPFALDPRRFEQAVIHLLDNVIKCSSPGGEVAVSISYGSEAMVLEFTVSGPGIPEEVLAHIFERFSYRPLVVRDRECMGGLGLIIAKLIVELHGGTITAGSRLKDKSSFTIRLPHLQSGVGHEGQPNGRARPLVESPQPAGGG